MVEDRGGWDCGVDCAVVGVLGRVDEVDDCLLGGWGAVVMGGGDGIDGGS